MRDLRSRGYYEQMKGRGVRSLDADGLQRVSASADGGNDAVGVEKSLKTGSSWWGCAALTPPYALGETADGDVADGA